MCSMLEVEKNAAMCITKLKKKKKKKKLVPPSTAQY